MPLLKVFSLLNCSILIRLFLKRIVFIPSIAFVNTRRISRFLATVLKRLERCLILFLKPMSIGWIAV
ncbi:hypothetical protein Godav_024477, partial [Gossypium davidsonii]|nr:hypothetical protein [Gossypium davidsonii]